MYGRLSGCCHIPRCAAFLFLVDRNNLGKQAEGGEFGMFRLTENGEPFNTIFTVSRLKSGKIPEDANVVIFYDLASVSLLKEMILRTVTMKIMK